MTAYLGDYEKIELKLKKIAGSQPPYKISGQAHLPVRQAGLKAAQAHADPKLLKELAKPTQEMRSIHEHL